MIIGLEDEDLNDAEDESTVRNAALEKLTDACRSDLHRALVKGVGSEAKLYSAMWMSSRSEEDAIRDEDDQWEVTGTNGAGYEFVAGGFVRQRFYY